MSQTDHESFPLAAKDANGLALSVGSLVRILSVQSCASGLPLDDQARLHAIVGHARSIVEFDRAGFVWLTFAAEEMSADFCLFPAELSRV